MLYTLDLKSWIIAFDKSTLLLRAVGQLKSHAWRARPGHATVEVRADTCSLVTSKSIYGALLHPSPLPRDTLLMPLRRSQKQLIILQPRDYPLPIGLLTGVYVLLSAPLAFGVAASRCERAHSLRACTLD